MPRNFLVQEMRGCRVEQRVLDELVRRKTPRVAALFAAAETALSEVTAEWMAYLFTRSLPSGESLFSQSLVTLSPCSMWWGLGRARPLPPISGLNSRISCCRGLRVQHSL